MRAVPQLMFQGDLEAALALWSEAFPGLPVRVLMAAPSGAPMLVETELGGLPLRLFDSPPVHAFGFTPAISLMIEVDAADEVDRLAGVLGAEVLMPADAYDFAARYAWVNDRYGVSWQIIHGPA